MPASNRRPLWIEGEEPAQVLVPTVPASQQQEPALLPAAAPPPAAATGAATAAAFKQPCTLKGAASALYAGMLGYFLGVVPAAIRFKARQWGMIHSQGVASAQQLALMSGMYTAVHCICQRIRLVEDGWNRGIAGCSTGLVLGWSKGPWSALQSCAGLGLISALVDLGGGAVEAAEASMLHCMQHQQEVTAAAAAREAADGRQDLLSNLPPPAQLLALLLGVPPGDLSSRIPQPVQRDLLQQKQQQQQQQKRDHRWQPGHVQSSPTSDCEQQAQEFLQQQQQQPCWMPDSLLQPVVQQLMSVPPLMFLGACCHSSHMAAAAGTAAATSHRSDVDACKLELPANPSRDLSVLPGKGKLH